MAPVTQSSSPSRAEGSVEERVLVLVSTKPSASEVVEVLRATNLRVDLFSRLPLFTDALQEGAGSVIVEEDAITERGVRLLSRAMAKREPWSNLPIIILTTGDPADVQRLDRLDLFGPATATNVTILERPVHEVTLTTVVRSALRARRRQYEVRDLMQNLTSTNEKLRQSQAALQAVNNTLEERVEERTEQIRELALALTTAEERERSRISEVLHDHVQQLVHGARIWAHSLNEEGEEASPKALERLIELLDEAIEATRSLSVELSPPVLKEEGFSAALDWLATHVAKTHGLQVDLEVASSLEISEENLRTLLFRSVRELVFNVAKHAGVDTAQVRARRSEGDYVVEVEDEGVGFDPDSVDENESNGHLGLFGVRKRLRLVGGTLTIDATPGQGTRARIEVPVPEERGSHE
jgi:signal transduction histidine kinase